MTTAQRLNLLLRVLMGVGVVVALTFWGIHAGDSAAAKVVLGVGAPVLGFGCWAGVDFHQWRFGEPLRLI